MPGYKDIRLYIYSVAVFIDKRMTSSLFENCMLKRRETNQNKKFQQWIQLRLEIL